jgi:HPt (histidine-containing phosphotransfer) domain-containing protein
MFQKIEFNTKIPRSSNLKRLTTFCDRTEGKLAVRVEDRFVYLSKEQTLELLNNLQEWLNELTSWQCRHCGQYNQTINQRRNYQDGVIGYDWLRCQCGKKTKLVDLDWDI